MNSKTHLKNDIHHTFAINTGYIYTDLCNQWSNHPRELIEQTEWKLKTILWLKKIVTVAYSENMKTYLEGKKTLLASYEQYAKDPNNPPYTEYFMHPNGAIGFDLIAYNENCILQNGKDENFDFFFTLKLMVLDIMQIEGFLEHQFSANFNSEGKQYESFLQALMVKYKNYFENTSIPEMADVFIRKHLKTNEKHPIPTDNTGNLKKTAENKKLLSENNTTPEKTDENNANTIETNKKNKYAFTQSAEENNPNMLSIEQASVYLNLAIQTIYGYTSRRAIPFYKPYKKVYFLKSELEEWVKQGKKPLKEIQVSKIKKTKRF